MYILQTKRNAKGRPHETEFWRPWNAEMKYIYGYSSKSRWENGVICLFITFNLRVVVIKILKVTHFLYFLLVTDSKKLVTVWVKYLEYLTALERSYWVFSENGMVNRLWSYRLWDIEGRNIKKLLSQQKKTKSSIFKGWHLPNCNSEPNNS